MFAREKTICLQICYVYSKLPKVHNGSRLQWYQQRRNCTKNNWSQIRIKSVSRLFLFNNGFGVKTGNANRTENIHERDQYDRVMSVRL